MYTAAKRGAPVRHRQCEGRGPHLRAAGDGDQDRQRGQGQDRSKHGITKHIKQAAEQIGRIARIRVLDACKPDNIDLQSGGGRRAERKRTRDAGEPVDDVFAVDAKGVVHKKARDEQASAHVTEKKKTTKTDGARKN